MSAVIQGGAKTETDPGTGMARATLPGPWWHWLVAILLGLGGLVLVVGPSVIGGHIPGDIGDARFNSYLLEHFYRWTTGQDASFWNADFFYPFPLTIAFSDNFIGDGFIYATIRAIGLDTGDAFRLWYVLGFAINFGAALYALARLGYSKVASASGAFLFSFGLPITAQEGHAQLIYRFGVPLAVLYLEEFRQRRQLGQLALAAFWTTWQFYCSLYTGYFLTLFLAALVAGHAICLGSRLFTEVRNLPSETRKLWKETPRHTKAGFLLTVAVLAALMVLIFTPYVQASRLYGFQRPWLEISQMLPRPVSYLLANNSRFWPASGLLFDALPMRHEHAMFIGGAPLLLIATAVALGALNRAKLDRLFAPVTVAILLLVLFTVSVDGHSAYRLMITWLPGVDAIRAVTRIIVILLFPAGLLVAASFDMIITAQVPAWARYSTVTPMTALLVFEASYITHNADLERVWQTRMAVIAAQLPQVIPSAPILLFAPDRNEFASWPREIDAMLFAQQRGWRTLNGYSGNLPPQHVLTGQCWDASLLLLSGLRFLGGTAIKDYNALISNVVTAGYPQCAAADLSRPPQVTSFAGPVPATLMADVRLQIERLSSENGQIFISATITNGSTFTIPGASTTDTPIRLAARFVDAAGASPDRLAKVGWLSRQELGIDIPPGTSLRVRYPIAPPSAAGTYKIALSMVQDGVAWFHDRGMPIPISKQTVTVGTALHISDDGS